VALIYEQNRISHVGCFNELEDQMCSYDKDNTLKSPDRMDAMVWAFYALMVKKKKYQGLMDYVKKSNELEVD
jgi:phage terminase large subunit-like protein